MTGSNLREAIAAAIEAATGHAFRPQRAPRTRTGSITDGYRTFFLKVGDADRASALSAEAEALAAIAATASVRVPCVVASSVTDSNAWLITEYLDLQSRTLATDAALGDALARMHRSTHRQYGWHRDNTIGPTPQKNAWHDDWSVFWRDERIGPQLHLARSNGYDLQPQGGKLLERIPELLHGHTPPPSLLHGDLWSGNAGALPDGTPVIYDPSAYYGDREADIAMTELFGGFSAAFYDAYRAAWPLRDGYERRRDLYNLYHVLNHLNLFGTGYLGQARQLMQRLLAER